MIHIENLSIGYRRKASACKVASGICGFIRRGELTCLLGENGVGKTTLLRTLSAFQPPLEGNILLDGNELSDCPPRRLARLLSVVLTEKCDIRNLSVAGLVGMGRSPYTGFWGMLTADDRRVVSESLERVGIASLARRMVHALSDGERQKAMIAKALAQQTPVIFLDEPTAFLDFPSKVEIMRLLHRFCHEEGKTVFLTTHDLELALQMADKIWLMGRGGSMVSGMPEDLALNGSLSRFFRRPGIAFDACSGLFRVDFEHHALVGLIGDGDAKHALAQKALRRAGIRAEAGAESNACVDTRGEGFLLQIPGREAERFPTLEPLVRRLVSACPGRFAL